MTSFKNNNNNKSPYVRQGDIWWVEIEGKGIGHEQSGRRPFYIISKTNYNKNSQTPVGFFISTSKKKSTNRFNIEIPYKKYTNDNENKSVFVNVSQIRTLASERFKKKFGFTDNNYIPEVLSLFHSKMVF